MESLLPETAEGRDACARPDEDARLGGVFGKLEAFGTEGGQRREATVLRAPGLDVHTERGLGAGREARWGRGSGAG
jgi:hypothetical protein